MSYTIKIAENDNAVLKIMQDDNVFESPRDWDNLGRMICWHRRYNLGDDHSYSSREDFIMDLARESLMNDETGYLEGLADEKYGSATIQLFEGDSDIEDGWAILDGDGEPYGVSGYYNTQTTGYDSKEDAETDLEYLIEEFQDIDTYVEEYADIDDLWHLITNGDNFVILPLYLYDHSGITMNTTGFTCRWDSGQVGYIYASKKDIVKEYGKFDAERAEKQLISEVKSYDQYITGDVYGFILEEKVKCESCGDVEYEHVDSCWGFYGLEYLEEELKSYIDKKYLDLINNLSWAN